MAKKKDSGLETNAKNVISLMKENRPVGDIIDAFAEHLEGQGELGEDIADILFMASRKIDRIEKSEPGDDDDEDEDDEDDEEDGDEE